MTRLFFVAGESSGDHHAADIIRALRTLRPDIACEGLGGPAMAAAGLRLHYDLASDAIMGFAEVVRRFPQIRRLFLDTVARLRASPPDALVLVDYPGFNLRLAKEAHKLGLCVIYYISPQVWAWKKDRLKTIARTVDRMLVIFPFEEDFYRDAGVSAAYVGHPMVERIARYQPTRTFDGDPVIALLPGSRAQEIQRLVPPMIAAARLLQADYPNARFYSAAVNHERAQQLRALAGDFPLEIVIGGMYDLLAGARFAWVASGTATLETALFAVPFGIVYRMNPLTYRLARYLVDIEHIGMVNILARKRVVPEYIQHEVHPETLAALARDLIDDTPARQTMLHEFQRVRAELGEDGAATRAAQEILAALERPRAGAA